jgi:hypothetical protein
VRVLVHHEPRVSLLEEVFHELNSEAAEAVSVGNHNLLDQAAVDAVQNGKKAFAAEVEAAANVGNDFVSRVDFLEGFDLARGVSARFLFGATDPCVDDALCLGSGCFDTLVPEEPPDAIKVVETLVGSSSSPDADCGDLALFLPAAQCGVGDLVVDSDASGGDVPGSRPRGDDGGNGGDGADGRFSIQYAGVTRISIDCSVHPCILGRPA